MYDWFIYLVVLFNTGIEETHVMSIPPFETRLECKQFQLEKELRENIVGLNNMRKIRIAEYRCVGIPKEESI